MVSDKTVKPAFPTHLRTFKFTEDLWNRLIAYGEIRSKQKAGFASTRLARQGTHQLGMVGEALFGKLVGKPVNTALLVEGDGKVDFVINGFKFDVKTTAYFERPWLRVTPADIETSQAFALVAVDEHRHVARYCGYATAASVQKAGMLKMSASMPKSYRLRESELNPDLPE